LADYGKSVYQDVVGWFQKSKIPDQVSEILSATLQQIGWAKKEIQKLLQLIPPDMMILLRHLIIEHLGVSPATLILLHTLVAVFELMLERQEMDT
jgi:hypothetical protein